MIARREKRAWRCSFASSRARVGSIRGRMKSERSSPGRAALLLAAVAAAACAQQRGDVAVPGASCTLPLLVTFAAPPGDRLLAELAGTSGARLESPAAITPTLYSITLSADGAEAVCTAALGRLRADPRVRAAELDERRGIRTP